MSSEPLRSMAARAAAELALVRVISEYGETPNFVVLGGLVPALLCSNSVWRHAGTTDIDVQVDLEIAVGSVDAPRLEMALQAAGFTPGKDGDSSDEGVWRWHTKSVSGISVGVAFDLLADLEDIPANHIIKFQGCSHLGAANLRGTKFATMDIKEWMLEVLDEGQPKRVSVKVAGVAGFLMAKAAAAHARYEAKDWYDIVFVLLNNDLGGVDAAVERVKIVFPDVLDGPGKTWLIELRANFTDFQSQGVEAYVSQMKLDHPELDSATLSGDALLAVHQFCEGIGLM